MARSSLYRGGQKKKQIRDLNTDFFCHWVSKAFWTKLLTISGCPFQYQANSSTPPKQRATRRRATETFHIHPVDDFFSTKTTVLSSRPISTSLGVDVYATILRAALVSVFTACCVERSVVPTEHLVGCCVFRCPQCSAVMLLPLCCYCVRMNFCQRACSIYAVAAASAEGKLQWCHSVSGDSARGCSRGTRATERKAPRPGGKEKSQNFQRCFTRARNPTGVAVSGWESGRSLLLGSEKLHSVVTHAHRQSRTGTNAAHTLRQTRSRKHINTYWAHYRAAPPTERELRLWLLRFTHESTARQHFEVTSDQMFWNTTKMRDCVNHPPVHQLFWSHWALTASIQHLWALINGVKQAKCVYSDIRMF